MAINPIQFQKGLSLAQFMKEYGTEEQCQTALIRARWSRGFECPRCSHGEAFEFDRRGNITGATMPGPDDTWEVWLSDIIRSI